jgi:hypothetical protein
VVVTPRGDGTAGEVSYYEAATSGVTPAAGPVRPASQRRGHGSLASMNGEVHSSNPSMTGTLVGVRTYPWRTFGTRAGRCVGLALVAWTCKLAVGRVKRHSDGDEEGHVEQHASARLQDIHIPRFLHFTTRFFGFGGPPCRPRGREFSEPVGAPAARVK